MLILNDLHLAVQRTGGTTPQSAQALRDYLRSTLAHLLRDVSGPVVVNGDLLDKFEVDAGEVVKVYELFADWLVRNGTNTLTLIQGNHDSNPRGSKLSSFHLLTHFLKSHFGEQIRVLDSGFDHIAGKVYAIPHMPNQELFSIEVDRACKAGGTDKYLLLHCNVRNTFAENSDHSLNLTGDLLDKLMLAGWTLVVGHEHQGYELRSGRVIVVGNQFPSSVADCLGNDEKHALQITEKGHGYLTTWSSVGQFSEVDWRDLSSFGGNPRFIRVVGDATSGEAANVIDTIAKFRQKSDAYVVSNAVKVDGVAALEEMASDSINEIKAFDVMGAILEMLDDKEAAVVKELMND